jgi:hypothetical protein
MMERMPDQESRLMSVRPDAEVHLENEIAVLYYYPRSKIVHHAFRNFAHDAAFRGVLEKGLELVRQRGATKWLSDDRGNGPVRLTDAKWALNDWCPRVLAAGWKYWAVVLPTKVLGQMNMRRLMDAYRKRGVTVETFSDPAAAFRWLDSQP